MHYFDVYIKIDFRLRVNLLSHGFGVRDSAHALTAWQTPLRLRGSSLDQNLEYSLKTERVLY